MDIDVMGFSKLYSCILLAIEFIMLIEAHPSSRVHLELVAP
jgi:hypothetical protein